jgi:thioredoxin-related protein
MISELGDFVKRIAKVLFSPDITNNSNQEFVNFKIVNAFSPVFFRVMRYAILYLILFGWGTMFPRTLLSQDLPLPAAEVIRQACSEASREKKNVFILFHASWCHWCHKMDTAMNDPRVKTFFTDHYIIRHVVVYENRGKEILENPGARELVTKYDGDNQGIPYWLIFEPGGKLLADSRLRTSPDAEPGNNVGCPAREEEVDYFCRVLKASSGLEPAALLQIRKRFLENGQ